MVLALFGVNEAKTNEVASFLERKQRIKRESIGCCSTARIFSPSRREKPRIIRDQQSICLILGSPEYQSSAIERGRSATEINALMRRSLKAIDSSFLVICIEARRDSFEVFSDRYGSKPLLYYAHQDFTIFSTDAAILYSVVNQHERASLNYSAMFEFLWFRRLFGEKTLVDQIKMIEPATHYRGKMGAIMQATVYWQPTPFTGVNRSLDEWAAEISDAITEAVEASIARSSKVGLMLSAGLDSRGLLAIGRERVVSFTNTPAINQEFEIASQLAAMVGSTHHHLIRPTNYLDKCFSEAILASNGMTLYYECQFLDYEDILKQKVERVQLGLFLDIFFCGHYMPKRHRKIANRQSVDFVLQKVSKDQFANQFIEGVSYRQKNTYLNSVLTEQFFDRGKVAISAEIDAISHHGRMLGFEGVELWEYMHLTNVGRHYSMLMASSLGNVLPVDVPALTIRNYDLAFALPVELKVNWKAYTKALCRLDYQLMMIRNGNLNFPANYPLKIQTLLKMLKYGWNQVQPGAFKLSPDIGDRSWPLVNESMKTTHIVSSEINQMLKNGKILDIGVVNVEKIRKLYDLTCADKEDHSIFLNQLLTLEKGVLDSL